jgi:hypothetical protein
METPTEDTEGTPPKDDSDEAVPTNEVESYESEWYEVLKRRSEELEKDADAPEGEGEDAEG